MKERTMKLNKFTNLLVIGMLSVAVFGCKKHPTPPVTTIPGSQTGKVAGPGPAGPITPGDKTSSEQAVIGGPGTEHPQGSGHPGWPEDAIVLKEQAVYFDFDSSVVKTSEKHKVAAVADYLKANKGKAVRVEGNCDERGTEEYNRALGERRALAVREELISLGIGATEVDTTSYGKDRPLEPGHNEAAWKKNRRDDFIVLSPPAK
jgi:peptidoglycan-associated lipoprotein